MCWYLDISSGRPTNKAEVDTRLYINYDVSANNEKVRLNSASVSWTVTHSMYYLNNRMVEARSGSIVGQRITRYPSTNTFNYATGFGYNDRIGGEQRLIVEFTYAGL